MNFKNISLILLFFLSVNSFAQNKDTLTIKSLNEYPQKDIKVDEFGNRYYYDQKQQAKIYSINGETVVVMDQLTLLKKPRFNNQLDQNFYFFLNKKLSRVYPLFLTALNQYRSLNAELDKVPESDRRKFAREKQQELANQYEAKLRDLTTTEGQIFTKLMYRATGKTVYEIIRDLRGGWSAFWWNVKGNIADVDIKKPYNPHLYREDEYLESLLQSNWNLGYLQAYEGFQDFKVSK